MAEPVPQAAASVVYPESDGKPVESRQHYEVAHYVMSAFRAHFGDSADYASNNGLYYEEGNPKKVVVPDVYWIADKPRNLMLRTYLLWEEGRVPNFVLELASATTKKRDAGKKRKLYACLGVKDYFRFDPVGGLMTPILQGLRLKDGKYEPVPAVALLDGGSSVYSEELKLELRAWPGPLPKLRFYDRATRQVLPSEAEAQEIGERERQAADGRQQTAERERQTAERERQAAERERDELARAYAALREQLAARGAPPGADGPQKR